MVKIMKTYPLKFRPIYKERIWGGTRLAGLFGKPLPSGAKIGESWELSDLPGDESVIESGELAAMTIGEAARMYPAEIVGSKDFAGQFPLLLKLLDAEDVLSVQVHPDEEACRRRGKGQPKTECWYIISAAKGSVIYKGLKPGVTRVAFEAAVADGTVADLLNKIVVVPGECHLLPAGTPHAIGAGLVIAEVQTPSDTTYRVFDWNRVDATGKPRESHVQDAMESIHFGYHELPVTTVGRLVDTQYFKVDKGHQSSGSEVLLTGRMRVLMFVQGQGRIISQGAEPVEFAAGQTLLIPAAFEGVCICGTETEYLTISL
jgi:mannose-6-phosphate isomerase